ncbi:putative retrotransposon protein [Klebsormidium nitens]|uniref:Putative retrotransposon protein n=1 Tax=Klebsormidium nitens TaxID=105231 RepID=A0A1Y1IEV6_KLENI|nr:putative retrotransposon protein [Klebsormidium nitens]|eukprot:GAQ89454.1 putative retrotransposon protein [Klebsormidium nitens]
MKARGGDRRAPGTRVLRLTLNKSRRNPASWRPAKITARSWGEVSTGAGEPKQNPPGTGASQGQAGEPEQAGKSGTALVEQEGEKGNYPQGLTGGEPGKVNQGGGAQKALGPGQSERALPPEGGKPPTPDQGGQELRRDPAPGINRREGTGEISLKGLHSLEAGGQELGPELQATAVGTAPEEKGASQFGAKGTEKPFEWGDEQIWPGLPPEQRAEVTGLLEEFRDIFAWSIYDLSDTAIEWVEFEVDFTDEKPIWSPKRRYSQYETDLLKAYVEERLAAKLIAPLKLPPGVKEPFAAATVMPRKKDAERNWTERRICGDYRPHNDKTVPDKYPMPIADELFDDLGESDCFSTLDLRMGYHQIRIREGDEWKLALGHDDLYMPLRTPFGPKNAPALFQRLMDRVLRELRAFARAFIDDTIVHAKGFRAHLDALRGVFTELRRHNIKVHPKKIRILFPEIPFLGHMVNPVGLKPQAVKVAAIQRIPYPTGQTAIKQFRGIVNYYRKFLAGCSAVARPLNDLLKKDVEFRRSWELNARRRKEFELHTDWSAAGCGAILQQRDDAGEERVVAYASRSNNKAESNYSSYAGECLAAVWGVRYFRVYLYGARFILYTDHRPLEWLVTNPNLTGMHARWALMLQEFDFEVRYRKGLINMNADGLSRNPQPETEDPTGARMHEDAAGGGDPGPGGRPAVTYLAWQAWAADTPVPPGELEYLTMEEAGGEPWEPEDELELPGELPMPGPMDYGTVDADVQVPETPGLGGERAKALTDIWEDINTLNHLWTGVLDPNWSKGEVERVRRRAQSYRFRDGVVIHHLNSDGEEEPRTCDGVLLRLLAGGEEKIVPAPQQRDNLVREIHDFTGHWGEKRTVHLLKRTYWWAGMYKTAQDGVASCQQCDRTKASFSVKMSGMKSLPIMGLGYRWSLDFAGPLLTTRSRKRYCLVIIEHFNKWCQLVALPSKHLGKVAEAFLAIMTRFGACAEVLTDNGIQRPDGALGAHHQGRHHPLGTEADRRTWDEWLPYLAMGYRMSPKTALGGYSPYFLLHGRHPMLTGEAVKQLVGTPVDFDTPEQWVAACHQRAEVLQREMPLALGNLLAAQHRDQRRYDHVRKTGYRPKVRKFEVGDLAYLRRQPADKTDVSVTREAYRVHQVGSNGRLVLQGADGTLFKEHIENCAPCHNPNIDTTIDPTLTTVTADHACQICKSPGRQATMLLCDYCLEGYHMGCLEPAVKEVPKGVWLCSSCTQSLQQG